MISMLTTSAGSTRVEIKWTVSGTWRRTAEPYTENLLMYTLTGFVSRFAINNVYTTTTTLDRRRLGDLVICAIRKDRTYVRVLSKRARSRQVRNDNSRYHWSESTSSDTLRVPLTTFASRRQQKFSNTRQPNVERHDTTQPTGAYFQRVVCS